MSGFNNIQSELRPNEELLELMASEFSRWWDDNKEIIIALEMLFTETCTMDQLGFIHDKATGELIAGSKLEWFNRVLGQEDI